MGGSYEQVGSAADVSNVNPMTGEGWNRLLQGQQGAQQGLQNLPSLMALLSGNATGLSDVASKLMGEYTASTNSLASGKAIEGIRNNLAQFSLMNGVNSGAQLKGSEYAATVPWLEAMTNQAQMKAGLAGQGMGLLGQGWQTQYQGMTNQLNNYNALMAQMAAPSWYEPTYAYQPGFMDYAAPIAGAGLGALAGGGLGGLFGGGGGGGPAPQLYGANNPYAGSGNWPYGTP